MFRKFSVPLSFILIAVFSVLISAFSLYGQSIRLDESQSIWVATKSVREIFTLMSQDVHPPLYHLLLHFWLQIFGTDIIFARTLSLVFFLLTLIAIYKLAKEASNETVGLLTILLFALSPFVLWFSNETRMYTLFTLVTTINNIYFLRVLRSEGRNSKLGYLVFTILGLYTHYFFFFVILTQIIFILIRFRAYRNLLITFLELYFVAALAFLPWGIFAGNSGFAGIAQPQIPVPTTFNVFQALSNFIFGFQSSSVQGVLISLWPLTVVFILLVFTNQPRNGRAREIDYFLMLSFLPILFTFAISFIRPIFLSRYLIFVLPSLFFLLAWAIESFSTMVSRILTTVLIVVMVGLLLIQNLSTSTPVREDYQGVSDYLVQTATPSDIIAVSAPFTIYPLEYSYTGHTKIDTIPLWDRYTTGPTPAFSLENLQTQAQNYAQIYNRLFLVLSYDQGYQDRVQGYFDSNFQLLESREFASGINLRIYKLRYN